MSPLLIEIVLHYHYSPRDFRDGDFSAPAVRDGIMALQDSRVIRPVRAAVITQGDASYELTDRGRAFVDALTKLPLPVCKWVMP